MNEKLGPLLEAFLNQVSHPRGRTLAFMARAAVTVDQAILLNHALTAPGSTPSALAAKMNLSLPSMSQMLERLVKLELLERSEDPLDRRRKTIELTPRAKKFLRELRAVRSEEFAAGTARLSAATRDELARVLARAIDELNEVKT
jgi:DNA-binding MarR family transcriptional regulator